MASIAATRYGMGTQGPISLRASPGPRQFARELVLDVRSDVGNLSMFTCYFEPLLLVVFAEDSSPGLRIFRLLFLAEFPAPSHERKP
jgi:hypothetical protein